MAVELTENALLVLRKRILARDDANEVSETHEEMFERVAKSIATADLQYDSQTNTHATEQAFLDVMTRLEFLPKLAYAHECRARLGPAFGLLCFAD